MSLGFDLSLLQLRKGLEFVNQHRRTLALAFQFPRSLREAVHQEHRRADTGPLAVGVRDDTRAVGVAETHVVVVGQKAYGRRLTLVGVGSIRYVE